MSKPILQETNLKPQQTSSTKGIIVIIAKATAILITVVAIFNQDLTALFTNAFQNEAATYVLFIPFLFTYLVYRKREMLKASMPRESNRLLEHTPISILAGTMLLLLSLLTYWYGSYTSYSSQYHILSLTIFILGGLLFLFNPATLRQLLFPVVYLFLLMPIPTETFSIQVVTIGTETIASFIAIAAFAAYMVRDRLWKKAVTFLAALSLVVVLISFYPNLDISFSRILTVAEWTLTLLGTIIILAATAKLLRHEIFSPKTEKCAKCRMKTRNSNVCSACGRILKFPLKARKSDLVRIAALSLAVIVLLYMQSSVLALTQAHPEITIPPSTGKRTQVSTALLPQLANYTLKFMYRDQSVEQKAKQNASLLYAYFPTNKTEQIIWTAIEIASSINNLPTWEERLGTSPRSHATIIEQTDIQLSQITGRYLSFNYSATSTLQTVLYWYDTSIFRLNTTSQQEQVEISLVAYPQNMTQLATTKTQLTTAAQAIVNYWQPAKTWSQISLLISQNGDILAAATTAGIALFPIWSAIETRREKQRNTIAFQKLPEENQQTVKSVCRAQETSIPTLNNITSSYTVITQKPTSTAEMLEKLSHIEKIGLVRREIGNIDDHPTQTWKIMCFCKQKQEQAKL